MSVVKPLRLALLLSATVMLSGAASAKEKAEQSPSNNDAMAAAFVDPPTEARPRVWWHWMNGNITEEGIRQDLAWMKRVGIGGAHAFDAAMTSPQIVPERLPFMSHGWKRAFRTAASEADRLGLELAIASSPGFTETGGPWVAPQDGLKKLVWSETEFDGGKPTALSLKQPPWVTGPYQSIPVDPKGGLTLAGAGHTQPVAAPFYRDIAVLAWPLAKSNSAAALRLFDVTGAELDSRQLTDEDFTSGIELARLKDGSAVLNIDFGKARTIRSARLHTPGGSARYAGGSLKPKLEASADGNVWKPVAEFPGAALPGTLAFAPVTARHFRIVFGKGGSSATESFSPPVPGVDFAALSRILGSGGAPPPPRGIRITDLRLSEEDRIDRGETKAGFDMALDYFALPSSAPDVAGVPQGKVIDLTGRLRPDGSLDWDAPPGRWRVLRLGWSLTGTVNHPAAPEATGLEVDKFDAAAVRRYLDHYLGLYRDAAGSGLVGKRGVTAFLNDSIESGPSNWTGRMLEEFRTRRRYDPLPWLPTLTGTIVESRSGSDRFLYDYRRTLSDLMAEAHYGTIASFAAENSLRTYGEAQENVRPQLGDDMAMRSRADVPMAALWTFPRERGPQPSYLVDMRGAASVANIYGKKYVAAEMMTSLLSPWAFGPRDLKRVADLAFATGVNLPVIHTSVHVPVEDRKPGLALSIFGQYFNRNESWAELAKPWTDYLARNAYMLQQGRAVADIAWFYGEEAPLTGLYSDKLLPNAPKTLGYDFINADALMTALVNDGPELVTRGGARYRALFLGGSSRMMTLAALKRIAALVEGGATVIGRRPLGDPGLSGDDVEFAKIADKLWSGEGQTRVGKGGVIVSDNPESALFDLGVDADFKPMGTAAGAEILFRHRHLPDGQSWFLSNRKDRTEVFEGQFRVTGKKPELYHPETGLVEPISYRIENGVTIVPLTLGPDGSVHVVFRKAATASANTVDRSDLNTAARLDDGWDVSFESGRGAPASAHMNSLAPLDENAEPGIRYFSGIATYTREFRPPARWKPGQTLWLDLGEAREIAEVAVNGKPAGGVWNAPYRIEIGRFVKRGRNRLTIRVANLWVNRMVGDAQPSANKIAWAASPTYVAKAPLRKSGLIGPVQLLVAGKGSDKIAPAATSNTASHTK